MDLSLDVSCPPSPWAETFTPHPYLLLRPLVGPPPHAHAHASPLLPNSQLYPTSPSFSSITSKTPSLFFPGTESDPKHSPFWARCHL